MKCGICGKDATHLCTRCGTWLCNSKMCEGVAIARFASKVTRKAAAAVKNYFHQPPHRGRFS